MLRLHEAMTICQGLQLVAAHSFLPLSVEADALRVINLCNGVEHSRLDIGNIIHDIKYLMGVCNTGPIAFVHMEGNQVAHGIAS